MIKPVASQGNCCVPCQGTGQQRMYHWQCSVAGGTKKRQCSPNYILLGARGTRVIDPQAPI